MTSEQLSAFKKEISQYCGMDLVELKRLIDIQIQDEYEQVDNFMLHTEIDEYIYVVYYDDSRFHYYCKGKDAYKEYTINPHALMIKRKTKDLYPTYELLLEKEATA